MHLKCSTVEFGGGSKVSFHPCGFLRRGKANVMQAFSRLLISLTATCLYWKLFGIFFFPLSKHLLLKSSNPLYSLVLHSAALVLLCVDKSLRVHASLICPTGEDVDGLAGRCWCLLLSLDIAPLRTPHWAALFAAVLWLALFKHVSIFCRLACSL